MKTPVFHSRVARYVALFSIIFAMRCADSPTPAKSGGPSRSSSGEPSIVHFYTATDVTPTTLYVEVGQRIAVPADPVRMGFAFVGWYTSKDFALASRFDFSAPLSAKEEIALYAKWDVADRYTLKEGGILAAIANPEGGIEIPSSIEGRPIVMLLSNGPRKGFFGQKFDHKNETIHTLILPRSMTAIADSLFNSCIALTRVVIEGASLKEMGIGAFSSCTALKQINLPASLKSIADGAFNNCVSMSAIELPSSVEYIGVGVFNNCSQLQAIEWPASSPIMRNRTFANCKSLAEVRLPGTLTAIGARAFFDCVALKQITLPASLTSLGSSVFYGCRGLVMAKIETSDPPNLLGSDPFYDTSDELSIKVNPVAESAYRQNLSWRLYGNKITTYL